MDILVRQRSQSATATAKHVGEFSSLEFTRTDRNVQLTTGHVASASADVSTSNSRAARIALQGPTKGIGSKTEFLLSLEYLHIHRLKPTLPSANKAFAI